MPLSVLKRRVPRPVRRKFYPAAWGLPSSWSSWFGPPDRVPPIEPPSFVGYHRKLWERAVAEAEAGHPGGLAAMLVFALDRHTSETDLRPNDETLRRLVLLLNTRLTRPPRDRRLPDSAFVETIRDVYALLGQFAPKSTAKMRREFIVEVILAYNPTAKISADQVRDIVLCRRKKLETLPSFPTD